MTPQERAHAVVQRGCYATEADVAAAIRAAVEEERARQRAEIEGLRADDVTSRHLLARQHDRAMEMTMEIDRLREALVQAAEWLESRPDYTEGDAAVSSFARAALEGSAEGPKEASP